VLHDTLILDFLLTFASNAIDDPLANAQNTLVLEIFYLLFRSIPPSSILPPANNSSGSKQPTATTNALRSALDAEYRGALQQKRHTTSRHSRFGTTVRLSSNRTGQSVILHRGAAVVQDKLAGDVLDRGKKKLAKRAKMRDELTGGAASAGGGLAGSGGETRLTSEVRGQLGIIARGFIESCFNRRSSYPIYVSLGLILHSILFLVDQGHSSREEQSHRERQSSTTILDQVFHAIFPGLERA
jgi:replication fork protection complex subunit Tof1/Swi1